MTMNDALDKLMQEWGKVPPQDGDYEENGLVYCGVCHEPRQAWMTLDDGKKVLIPAQCKCVKDRIKKEQEEEERWRKQETIRSLRRNSLMDRMFDASTFTSWEKTPANEKQFNMCLKYAKHFRQMFKENQGLLLCGQVGTGKSFAAACIANMLIDNCIPVVMTSLVILLKHLSSDMDDQEATIHRLTIPDLLILDDLGAERSTDYALEKVYDIIDSRYRSNKPLILTTNLTIAEMKSTTDIRYARIYDRVFEMCYPIQFDGISRRKVEAKRRFDRMKAFFEGDDKK